MMQWKTLQSPNAKCKQLKKVNKSFVKEYLLQFTLSTRRGAKVFPTLLLISLFNRSCTRVGRKVLATHLSSANTLCYDMYVLTLGYQIEMGYQIASGD